MQYVTKKGKVYKKYAFSSLDKRQRLFVSFAVVKCKELKGAVQYSLKPKETIYTRIEPNGQVLLVSVWNDTINSELICGAVELDK